MGDKYIESTTFDMEATFKETNNMTPIFFVLFPGIDPTKDVEELGEKMDKSIDAGTFINIPMGQGQEDRANRMLEECAKEGKWIMLQNLHLMQKWIKTFENNLERVSQTADPNFRCSYHLNLQHYLLLILFQNLSYKLVLKFLTKHLKI